MEKIYEFFENMNEYVYVADIDSYEMLYMNKKTRETFGFLSQQETVGKKCYEVLHGCNSPCSICNNQELCVGEFKEWQYYNPVVNKMLSLKDTLLEENGRRLRIEIAMDITAREQQSNMLRSYENLEALANEGLRIALQAPTPDKSIDVILEYLGKALKGERTYIFEKNESGGDDNTYEWVANGVVPEKENLQNVPPEVCANWYRNFSENKNTIIKNLEDIREENPLQYDILKRQEIHSLVVVPLYRDKQVIGFFGVDNPPEEALDYAQNMFQIMAHFIVSCIKRRELVKQLQQMSYLDPLTRLGNRFAMDEYVEHTKEDESIGIIYCDITGLKQVNDTEGHKAGDRLIVNACECLKRVFGDYGLFRIGGDELLVLCHGIGEDELQKRVDLLKRNMQEQMVNLALGTVWQKDGRAGIDRMLTEAEKLMYQDKSAYYKRAGLDRRK